MDNRGRDVRLRVSVVLLWFATWIMLTLLFFLRQRYTAKQRLMLTCVVPVWGGHCRCQSVVIDPTPTQVCCIGYFLRLWTLPGPWTMWWWLLSWQRGVHCLLVVMAAVKRPVHRWLSSSEVSLRLEGSAVKSVSCAANIWNQKLSICPFLQSFSF